MTKSFSLACAVGLAVVFGAPAFASEFAAQCAERASTVHPDLEDAAAACACLDEKTTDAQKAELLAAESPDDLSDEIKAIMAECGFGG